MSFDPSIWISAVRSEVLDGSVLTAGRMRDSLQIASYQLVESSRNRLLATKRPETERIMRIYTGAEMSDEWWRNLIDAFATKSEALIRTSSRSQTPPPLLDLPTDAQAGVIDQFFDEYVMLSTRWGAEPSPAALKKLPIMFMTAGDYDQFREAVPQLSSSEARFVVIHTPSDPKGFAQQAFKAMDELIDLGLARSQAKTFAFRNAKDPKAAVQKMHRTIDSLLESDMGLTEGEARRIAINNPNDPYKAAHRSLDLIDKITTHDFGLTKTEIRFFAFSFPLDAIDRIERTLKIAKELIDTYQLGSTEARFLAFGYKDPYKAAQRVEDSIDALLNLDAGLTRAEAQRFAIHSPGSPIKAAKKALEAMAEISRLLPGIDQGDARHLAIHNAKDPIGAARKLVEVAKELLPLGFVSDSEARRFAAHYPKNTVEVARRAFDLIDEVIALDPYMTKERARYAIVLNPNDPIESARRLMTQRGVGDSEPNESHRLGTDTGDSLGIAISTPGL